MRFVALLLLLGAQLSAAPGFHVKFASAARSTPVDGRLIVIVSKAPEGEPRNQFGYGTASPQIFGVDVNAWKPGDATNLDGNLSGTPVRTLRSLPPGKYRVQAVLNVYE